MFYKAKIILEKTESNILGLPTNNELWTTFTRHVVFPLKYLALGIKEFIRPTSIWAFMAFGLVMVSAIALSKSSIDNTYQLYILNFCFYFPIILVVFSVPSTYSFYGVKGSHVEAARETILAEEITSKEEVEILEGCLERIEKRTLSRVVFYNWLIGAFWAIYIIILNFELRLAAKENQDISKFVTDTVTNFSITLLSVIFALAIVSSYKKSSELLIKSIEFACSEIKHKTVIQDLKLINGD